MDEKLKRKEETQKLLRSVLMPNKNGLLLKDLSKMYREFTNQNIPFSMFGYPSLVSFLESIPDFVSVQELSTGDWLVKAVADESVKLVAKLVARQDTKKTSQTRAIAQALKDENRLKHQKLRTIPAELQDEIINLLKKYPLGINLNLFDARFKEIFGHEIHFRRYGYNSVKEMLSGCMAKFVEIKSPSRDTALILLRNEFLPDQGKRPDTYGSEDGSSIRKFDGIDFPITKSVESVLRQIIEKYPNGIPYVKLPGLYEKNSGHMLDYRDYNCISIADLCRRLPSIFFLQDDIIYPAKGGNIPPPKIKRAEPPPQKPRNTPQANLFAPKNLGLNVPDDVISAVKRVLMRKRPRLKEDTLLDEYQRLTGKSLNVYEYGAKNVEEFLSCGAFDEIKFEREMYTLTNTSCLFIHIPPEAESKFKKETVPLEFFVGREKSIPRQEMPDLSIFDCVEVEIGEVFRVDHFFILLKPFAGQLLQLMHDLQIFFRDPNNLKAAEIDLHQLVVGMYCAAIYGEEKIWHRAVLIKMIGVSECEIEYIDYGTKKKVHSGFLRFLPLKLSLLPRQAIPARLASIRPAKNENRFPREATDKFFSLLEQFKDNTFQAQIRGNRLTLHSQEVSVWLSVKVLTTNGEKEIEINDELIRLGLVEKDPDGFFNDDYNILQAAEEKHRNAKLSPEKEQKPLRMPFSAAPANAANKNGNNSSGFVSSYKPPSSSSTSTQVPNSASLVMPQNIPVPFMMPSMSTTSNSHVNQLPFYTGVMPFHNQMFNQFPATPPGFFPPGINPYAVQQMNPQIPAYTSSGNVTTRSTVPNTKPLSISQKSSTTGGSIVSAILKKLDPSKPLLKKVILTSRGHSFHIFNLGQTPYVVSSEISALFPRWKGDYLSKMLSLKNERKPKLVFKRNEAQVIFEACIMNEISGVVLEEDDIVEALTFYPLSCVPDLLNLFLCPMDAELFQAVETAAKHFDPCDLFWSGDQEI